jgi:hypothetical protein
LLVQFDSAFLCVPVSAIETRFISLAQTASAIGWSLKLTELELRVDLGENDLKQERPKLGIQV